jgi:hypothetical protein
MNNSKFPYLSVSHYHEETKSQLKFLKDIPLNKYRKSIANRYGFKSIKLFEEHIINKENIENIEKDNFETLMIEEFNQMCKKSLTDLIMNKEYIDEAKLRLALLSVYEGGSKNIYDYVHKLNKSAFQLELSHISIVDNDKMKSILMYMLPKECLQESRSSNPINESWYKVLNHAYFLFLRKHYMCILNGLYADFGYDYISNDNSDEENDLVATESILQTILDYRLMTFHKDDC